MLFHSCASNTAFKKDPRSIAAHPVGINRLNDILHDVVCFCLKSKQAFFPARGRETGQMPSALFTWDSHLEPFGLGGSVQVDIWSISAAQSFKSSSKAGASSAGVSKFLHGHAIFSVLCCANFRSSKYGFHRDPARSFWWGRLGPRDGS